MIVMAWHFVNIILATGAFGVMFERARPQVAGAIPRSKPVNLVETPAVVVVDMWMQRRCAGTGGEIRIHDLIFLGSQPRRYGIFLALQLWRLR